MLSAVFQYFDAVTGRELKGPLPVYGVSAAPIDFNGDGYLDFMQHRMGSGYDHHSSHIACGI